jgi:hypothetical protein
MSSEHRLRCYDYVNQPFERVRDVMRENAQDIVRVATSRASQREQSIAAQLRVRVGVLEIATDVSVELGKPEDTTSSPFGYEVVVFPLSWNATSRPSLFPHMKGKLLVYPLSRSETQLEFEGTYDPPFGLLGEAIDALAGKRIAEASVLTFVQDIAAHLRKQLAAPLASNG